MMKDRRSSKDMDRILLSSDEVIEIMDDINEHFSPIEQPSLSQNKKPSAEELREISANISLYYAPSIPLNSKNLVLLPIDPTHIYAYWSLSDQQMMAMQVPFGDQQLTLKVFSQTEKKDDSQNVIPVYQTTINHTHSGTIIKLASPDSPAVYSAFIGIDSEQEGFEPLLKSNSINIDKVHLNQNKITEKETINEAYQQVYNDLDKKHNVNALKPSNKKHYASSNNSGQIRKNKPL